MSWNSIHIFHNSIYIYTKFSLDTFTNIQWIMYKFLWLFLSIRTKRFMHKCQFVVVQAITIFKNPVTHVHPAAFQGLVRLKSLTLSSAQLRVAPSLQFIGNSLLVLYLSYSNVEFKTGYLKHGYIMQTLSASYNNLREMPASLCMIADSLETLSLQGNSITTLKPLHDIRFTRLKWLFLSRNKIYALDPDALWLPYLIIVDLTDNHIRQITDISTVSWGRNVTVGKAEVNLDGNPWHCNASMNWLLQGLHRSDYGIFFKRNSFMISVENWFCATPQEYQGRLVVDVLSIKPTTKNGGRKVNRGILCLTVASAMLNTKWYNVNNPSLWYGRALKIY